MGSQICSLSSSSLVSSAPVIAPQTEPMPPTTLMNRYSMPIFRPKGEGLTERWKCANSQPDSEASSAATTKISTL